MISSFHRRKNYPSGFWKLNYSAKSARIRSAYQSYQVQPALGIEDDALTVTFPALHNGAALGEIPGSDRLY